MDFPYGELTTTPPNNFFPPEMWPEYGYLALPRWLCDREPVGKKPAGIRWSFGPLTFEEYTTDEAPKLEDAHGRLMKPRFVAWRRFKRTDTLPGWRAYSSQAWRIDGYAELQAGVDYTERWHPQARRNLRLWKSRFEGKTHEIVSIDSIEEFRAAYEKSTIMKKIGDDALTILERKVALSPNDPHRALWGVRDLSTGTIIAGFSLCHSPTYACSAYESPFILPEARHTFAMTALIDHWYKESIRRDTPLVVYNSFWQRGSPRDWKNFSAFKAQFNPTCYAYPPTLWRFVGGKFF